MPASAAPIISGRLYGAEALGIATAPDFRLTVPQNPDLSLALLIALQRGHTAIQALKSQMEGLPPDDIRRASHHRIAHFYSIAESVGRTAQIEGVPYEELVCETATDFLHDMGRVPESLFGFSQREIGTLKVERYASLLSDLPIPNGKTEFRTHSILSLEFIADYKVLEFFPPELSRQIRLAILYHAERELDLPEGSLAKKIALKLVNPDKMDIILWDADHYLLAKGVENDFTRHFFGARCTNKAEILRTVPNGREILREHIANCLGEENQRAPFFNHVEPRKPEGYFVLSGSFRDTTQAMIRQFMFGGVSQGALDDFYAHRTPNFAAYNALSRGNYLLAQLGQIWGLTEQWAIDQIKGALYDPESGIQRRMDALRGVTTPDEHERIMHSMVNFLKSR